MVIGTAPAAPVIPRITMSPAGTVHRAGASRRSRRSRTSATPVALGASVSAGRTTRGAGARSATVFIRARSASAFSTVRTDETRQLGLCLAIPDAVRARSCLLVAYRLDVGSVAADKLAMRFLAIARTLWSKGHAKQTETSDCPCLGRPVPRLGGRRAVKSRSFRPGTVSIWTVGARTF